MRPGGLFAGDLLQLPHNNGASGAILRIRNSGPGASCCADTFKGTEGCRLGGCRVLCACTHALSTQATYLRSLSTQILQQHQSAAASQHQGRHLMNAVSQSATHSCPPAPPRLHAVLLTLAVPSVCLPRSLSVTLPLTRLTKGLVHAHPPSAARLKQGYWPSLA